MSPFDQLVQTDLHSQRFAPRAGFGCLLPSSSSERVPGRGSGRDSGDEDVGHIVFSIGASAGDATKDQRWEESMATRS